MFELNRTQRLLHRVARWLVTGTVVLSPWLLASGRPCAYVTVCMGVTLALALYLFSLVGYPQSGFRAPALTAALVLLLMLLVLQILPLPLSLIQTVSPLSADVVHLRNQLFQSTGLDTLLPAGIRGAAEVGTISVAPRATLRSVCLFVAYLGGFVVMVNCARRWRHIRNIATTIVVAGFILAVVSLIHKLSGSPEMLWFYSRPDDCDPFGAFTNRNHFAFHMILLFGLALGLLLSAGHVFEIQAKSDWRERLAWLSTERASRLALLAFAAALLGGAVGVSLSRGGIASLALAMGAIGIVSGLHRRSDVRWAGRLWVVVLLVVAVVLWLGWQPVVTRLASLPGAADDLARNSRMVSARDTMMILGAFPVLGCGFGAFQYIFPLFQSPEIQFGHWLHAHNDWVEFLVEGGVVGGVLLVLVLAFFCHTVRSRFPDAIARSRLFVLGLLVSITAAALHSLLDYSLQKPANAMLLAVLCGLVVSAVHLQATVPGEGVDGKGASKDDSHDPEQAATRGEWAQHRVGQGAIRSLAVRIVAFIGLVLLTWLVLTEGGVLRGELAFARFAYAARLVEKLQTTEAVEAGVTEAATESELAVAMGACTPDALRDMTWFSVRWAMSDKVSPAIRLRLAGMSERLAALTADTAPSDYLAWLWLARSQALVGRWEEAESVFQRAQELKPTGNPPVLFYPDREGLMRWP